MAALLASRLILAEYIRRVRACEGSLTHSLLICEVSPELLESLEEDKKVMKQISAIRFDGDLFEHYFPIMELLATAAEKSYRDLTDETGGLYDYFYQATVVKEIGLINIGSRPARRNATIRDKTSLRAIPWVFGWAQSRHTLPAWYGVGSGILNYTRDEPDRIKELQTMYQEWPFFRTFLSNVQESYHAKAGI